MDVALIGAGLIGRRIQRDLTERGDRVQVFDLRPENDGDIEMDVTSEASIVGAIAKMRSKGIRPRAVINCSYPRGPGYGKPLAEVSLEQFNQNVSMHLGGYFAVMKNFGQSLAETGGGCVVSFASIYGVAAPRFDIYEGHSFTMPVEYAAVKAAVIHLTKYMTRAFAEKGVRFNCVSPGGIFDGHNPSFVAQYGKYAAQKKGLLGAEEILTTVRFLIDEGSSAVNGQNLIVDDGWTL